jgi:hypothetical protein
LNFKETLFKSISQENISSFFKTKHLAGFQRLVSIFKSIKIARNASLVVLSVFTLKTRAGWF